MRKITKEKLQKAILNSISIAEALKFLEMSISTGNYRSFHKYIKEYELDTNHFKGQSHLKGKSRATFSLNEILVQNSNYAAISTLKERLVNSNLLEYKCYGENCGISSWHNRKLSLQLDHINGIHNDHRLENLRFLCPNCHSQTETFAGKKLSQGEMSGKDYCKCGAVKRKESTMCRSCINASKFKIVWPSIVDLKNMVDEFGYSATARKLGVSATSVKKKLVGCLE